MASDKEKFDIDALFYSSDDSEQTAKETKIEALKNKQNEEPELIIVPDVHGRTFWKTIKDYGCNVVFLGDYLDPYPHEGISRQEAIDNFREILAYASTQRNVRLLLGNHDIGYILGRHICSCRCDDDNYSLIRQMFSENSHLFELAYDCTIGGKRFLLSHAGVTYGWYSQHRDFFGCKYEAVLDAEYINGLYHSHKLDSILGEAGEARGGNGFGSILWADFGEFIDSRQFTSGSQTIQIVGHTCYGDTPADEIKDFKVYDADARCCSQIDSHGNVSPMKDIPERQTSDNQ